MYQIHDTHELPQCGVEITSFAEWWEVEEFLDEHPDVIERIEGEYATIVKIDEPPW